MSITILNYHDQSLIDSVNAAAAERADAERLAAEQAALAASQSFDAVLDETTQALSSDNTYQPVSSAVSSSDELNAIFEEAASAYGVSSNLLKSIAKAESGFNANAVSHAGAVGIMQLMPATAASLGVSNSYDERENIMGGAKLISQLLIRYNGDTSLALAAYNAGGGNVDKYGGIPPFKETQNYVQKVLAYMGETVTVTASPSIPEGSSSDSRLASDNSSVLNLTESERAEANELVENILNSKNISNETLEMLNILLKISQSQTPA